MLSPMPVLACSCQVDFFEVVETPRRRGMPVSRRQQYVEWIHALDDALQQSYIGRFFKFEERGTRFSTEVIAMTGHQQRKATRVP